MAFKLSLDNLGDFNFSFLGIWMLTVENGYVPDNLYHFAFCRVRDLGGHLFFIFFELAEFYLDEFMIFQREIHRTDECIRQTFCTDNHQRI